MCRKTLTVLSFVILSAMLPAQPVLIHPEIEQDTLILTLDICHASPLSASVNGDTLMLAGDAFESLRLPCAGSFNFISQSFRPFLSAFAIEHPPRLRTCHSEVVSF